MASCEGENMAGVINVGEMNIRRRAGERLCAASREALLRVVGGICPQEATDAMVSAAENCFASAGRDEIRRAWRAMFDEATRNG